METTKVPINQNKCSHNIADSNNIGPSLLPLLCKNSLSLLFYINAKGSYLYTL